MPTNDNDADARSQQSYPADAHGEAALVLVESLIHGLIVRSVLTTKDSVDIVTSAAEVQADHAADGGEETGDRVRSQTLLTRIADSLSLDIAVPAAPAARGMKPVLVDVNDRSRNTPPHSQPAPDRGNGIDQ